MSQPVPMRNIMHDAQMDVLRTSQERSQTIREPVVQPEIVTEGAYNRQHDERMRRNRLAQQRMNNSERALRSAGLLTQAGARKRSLTKRNKKSKKHNKRNKSKKSKRRH
jgi:hypothetical protein